ncbi:MAG: hypothetical protein R2911_23325 [Caldilineaceae bacterium]
MATSQYIFVLWGSNFNEAVAAIFVTELRQAGLRVKVVGLDGELPVGSHGLALSPDMPLSKALPLAGRTLCVIAPCDAQQWRHIQHDPRLTDFLAQVQQYGGWLITEPVQQEYTISWTVHPPSPGASLTESADLINYTPPAQLTPFVRQLAGSLAR